MKTKYRVTVSMWAPKIEQVEITRETEAQVVILSNWSFGPSERRENKKTGSTLWVDTWEEAHAALMAKAEANVMDLRRQLEQANGYAGNIKGMKPPVKP